MPERFNNIKEDQLPEKKKEIDFVQIFEERLKESKDLEKGHYASFYKGLKEINISEVKKIIPGFILLDLEDGEVDIWLKSKSELGTSHGEIEKNLENEIDQRASLNRFPSFLIVALDGKRFISVREYASGDSKEKMEKHYGFLLNLVEKYKIDKIFLQKKKINKKNEEEEKLKIFFSFTKSDPVEILDDFKDINEYAEKYKMTNSQFLRFRLRKKAAEKEGISMDYDKLAQEIVSEEE